MWCGQRCSYPLVDAFHSHNISLCLPLSFLFILHPLTTESQSNPLYPTLPIPSNPFFSKEEELDYFTPPVWASHLTIFLPVDHQPARVAMEGEIRRSTSPQQPLFLSISATCMVLHCADWGGANVTLNYFVTAFCPLWQKRHHPRAAFQWKCQHECRACHRFYYSTTAFLSFILNPEKLFLTTEEPLWFSLYCSALFLFLIFLSSFLSTLNKALLLPFKTIFGMDKALMAPPKTTRTRSWLLTSFIFFRSKLIPKKELAANFSFSDREVCWEHCIYLSGTDPINHCTLHHFICTLAVHLPYGEHLRGALHLCYCTSFLQSRGHVKLSVSGHTCLLPLSFSLFLSLRRPWPSLVSGMCWCSETCLHLRMWPFH